MLDNNSNSKRSILVILHRIFSGTLVKKGGVDPLIDHLKAKGYPVSLIEHPLWDYHLPSRISTPEKSYVLPSFFIQIPLFNWFWEIALTLFAAINHRRKFEIIIAADPLCFLAAYLLRCLGIGKKIHYHSVDFSEVRFGNQVLNGIYLFLYRMAVRESNSITYVSRPMGEKIKEFIGETVFSERTFFLPNSPVFQVVPKNNSNFVGKPNLVVTKGRYSMSEIERIIKIVSDSKIFDLFDKLNLIGLIDDSQRELIEVSEVRDKIIIFGLLSREENLSVVSNSALGLAWYENVESFEKYADSLKIREYAAAGIPSVTNKGISTAVELESFGAGFAVETLDEFTTAVKHLLEDKEAYLRCHINSLKWAEKMDKNILLESLLSKL